MKRRLVFVAIGLAAIFGVMQLVPYRVSNSPVKQEPTWDSGRTRQLAVAACFDCHSNQVNTYSWEKIAPLSWWIKGHVDSGRSSLNLSECTQGGGESDDAVETIREGSMPPGYFTWFGLHSSAKLTSAEKDELAAGLQATLSGWNCGDDDEDEDEDD